MFIQEYTLIEHISWALFHSIWQISLIALWLYFLLRIISSTSAKLRYAVSTGALLLSFILPLATFLYISAVPAKPEAAAVRFSNETEMQAGRIQTTVAGIAAWTDSVLPATFRDVRKSLGLTINKYGIYLAIIWLIGMLVFSLRTIGGIWRVHQLKTVKVSQPDEIWIRKLTELSKKLKIKQKVLLLKSSLVDSPMIIGWIKPVILVPAGVFLQMDPRQLEMILAHELMHSRRLDYLINIGQHIIEIVFFYHPCVWWISNEVRREREFACDEAVVSTLENAKIVYATALTNLEQLRLETKRSAPRFTVAANGGKLMNRIQRIIENKKTTRSGNQNSLWSASLASALILAFLTVVFWVNVVADVNHTADKNPTLANQRETGTIATLVGVPVPTPTPPTPPIVVTPEPVTPPKPAKTVVRVITKAPKPTKHLIRILTKPPKPAKTLVRILTKAPKPAKIILNRVKVRPPKPPKAAPPIRVKPSISIRVKPSQNVKAPSPEPPRAKPAKTPPAPVEPDPATV